MLSLFGALVGFLSSAFPEVIKFFQDKQDRHHELAILDRQLEQQRLSHQQRLNEIAYVTESEQRLALYWHDQQLKGAAWVESLRASVRPCLTYAFFMVFACVKVSLLYWCLQGAGMTVLQAIPYIWDEETQAVFAAVISFWFGQRALQKRER